MSDKTIQFIQTTPEHLIEGVLQVVKNEIETLKKEFQPKVPNVYLTRAQVAELFQVDISTVHNWTVKGKLKAYGMGNRVYYLRSQVESGILPLNP